MTSRAQTLVTAAALALLCFSSSEASSAYLLPASSDVQLSAGTATLELFMDFTGTPTIGGGIDLDLTGPISFGFFTPSSYFNGLDSLFSGHGITHADADYEIHFGDFAGLSGVNKLGDVNVNLLAMGIGQITLAINQYYGSFYGTNTEVMTVALDGAQVNIVPLPATAWMLLTGVVSLAIRKVRRHTDR